MTDLEAANEEFFAAFEGADLDRMEALWADGPDVACVHPGWAMLRGREEVMRSWALIMANTPYIQFVLTDVRAEIFGDRGVVTCSEHILTAEEGSDVGFVAGGSLVTTNVFVRVGDEWRLCLHHGSPVLNQIEEE
ncbi:DUF4440 domain-containing protein [Actinomadura craniellae]|uniref:DUF4440 domain-containing protein n=1 Tax=Actinomadura craniellae TaxID=2231787 RepID=A0A365HB43_9ACTN|nr:nuclear transport factor 2 family protein [Actinomadura craniellae]RAY15483.1 DUF4440 domain-containing protein [Actinomadura craniellae]